MLPIKVMAVAWPLIKSDVKRFNSTSLSSTGCFIYVSRSKTDVLYLNFPLVVGPVAHLSALIYVSCLRPLLVPFPSSGLLLTSFKSVFNLTLLLICDPLSSPFVIFLSPHSRPHQMYLWCAECSEETMCGRFEDLLLREPLLLCLCRTIKRIFSASCLGLGLFLKRQ